MTHHFQTLLLLVEAQLRVIWVVAGIALIGILLLTVALKATVVLLAVRLIVLYSMLLSNLSYYKGFLPFLY